MIVIDLALYHSFLALISLTIATASDDGLESLEINQAYLSFLKPSNIYQSHIQELKNATNTGISFNNLREKPKGVLLGMFKMDCLALFGRHVLNTNKLDAFTIDSLLRQVYSKLL